MITELRNYAVNNVVRVARGGILDSRPIDIIVRDGVVVNFFPTRSLNLKNFEKKTQFLTWGMANGHTHVSSDPFFNISRSNKFPAREALYGESILNLQQCFEFGVTLIRDLGSPYTMGPSLRSLGNRGRCAWPKILTSGPVLTHPQGHGSRNGIVINGEQDIYSSINYLQDDLGVDHIKVTLGFAGGNKRMPDKHLELITDIAHDRGLKVAAHANFDVESLEAAISVGVDSIEHGYRIESKHAAEMSERGIALCFTASAIEAIVNNPDHWLHRGGKPMVEQAEAAVANLPDVLSATRNHNVSIIIGTDGGVDGVGFDSSAIQTEISHLVAAGYEPPEILRSVTESLREWTGNNTFKNPMEVGEIADFAVFRNNPLFDGSLISSRTCSALGKFLSIAALSDSPCSSEPDESRGFRVL